MLQTTTRILAIGASTGGTEAIREILEVLPPTTPGTLIVQHMPAYFTKEYAKRLNNHSAMEVREAEGGEVLRPGLALIAPGNFHLSVQRVGGRFIARVQDGPAVHYQRPSADVLFYSVAKHSGSNALGVILTGMGVDGAAGLLAMRKAGARTIGQDEASSVVYGMPKAAADLGAVETELPLHRISAAIIRGFRMAHSQIRT